MNPKLETLRAICRVLDCTLGDLDDSRKLEQTTKQEREHLKKYRACDDRGRETVDYVLDHEYERSTGKQTQETVVV